LREDIHVQPSDSLSPAQAALLAVWEKHLEAEFRNKNATESLATMVERPVVNHVPVLTGGVGRRQLECFYGRYFIPQMPPDVQLVPLSRTIGQDRIVDEFVFTYTHTVQMDWFLPGVPPTGRRIEVPMVVVIQFVGDKIAAENIYWDQASVLVQVGLLDPAGLPVAGVESARKVLDPSLPSNALMKRTIADADL
jgi:carboxymethylenebutenolidase